MRALWAQGMLLISGVHSDICTAAHKLLSRQSMFSNTMLNWITGFVACLFVLSFLSYFHNATYQIVTYVHELFTGNTCNRDMEMQAAE